MNLKTVTLPRDYQARFPDACVVCHGVPDSTAKIAHTSHNPILGLFFPIVCFFGWSRVEFPICRRCKLPFRIQRWGREVTGWMLMLIALWLIAPYFEDWPKLTRKFVVLALVVLAVSPHFIAEVLWPRIFTTSATGDSIDYEFKSLSYALEFRVLNEPGSIADEDSIAEE